jgi:hypothetical protein
MKVLTTTHMNEKMKAEKREAFLRAYANLPLNARREIVVVLDPEGPLTWEAACFEIKNSTPRSDILLEKLVETKII